MQMIVGVLLKGLVYILLMHMWLLSFPAVYLVCQLSLTSSTAQCIDTQQQIFISHHYIVMPRETFPDELLLVIHLFKMQPNTCKTKSEQLQ